MKKPRKVQPYLSIGTWVMLGLGGLGLGPWTTAIGRSATPTHPEWRCQPTDPSQSARFHLRPSQRNDGTWIASVDECPLNSAYPCGGLQASVDPETEEGWVNYYQHGFPRLIASIEIVEKSDGTHAGRLFTTQGRESAEFACVPSYVTAPNE